MERLCDDNIKKDLRETNQKWLKNMFSGGLSF
jgi:hypothetical protein